MLLFVRNILADLGSGTVRDWHNEWIRLNEDLLDKIAVEAPNCRRAVFTGRGSANNYLRDCLTAKLASLHIKVYDSHVKYPCSRGALLHYFFEEDQPKFRNATFYTTQSETFDRKVHTDVATPTRKRRIGKGKKRAPPSKKKQPRPYKWNAKELIVEDRLLPLMDIIDNECTNVVKIPMQFDIDARMPSRLHFDIYSTTQPHRHSAHGPLRDADGSVLESFTQYPIAFLDLPELSEYFSARPVHNRKGDMIYVVCGFVEMRKSGDTLEVRVTLLCHGFAWQYDENGIFASSQKYDSSQIIYEASQEIWDPNCSSFVRGNVIDAQTARLGDAGAAHIRKTSTIEPSHVYASGHGEPSPMLDRQKIRLAERRSRKQTLKKLAAQKPWDV